MAGHEVLTDSERLTERVLLLSRLRSGLPLRELPDPDAPAVTEAVEEGLAFLEGNAMVLTRRGRLLADAVVLSLLR